MREIKFRGKNIDSQEWVYGDLIHGVNYTYINTSVKSISVDEKLVGQYTGLKDKHGNEIYEGDIVRVSDISYSPYFTPYQGFVVFKGGSWCVCTSDKSYSSGFSFPSLFLDDFADKKTEIIGNIYDNIELLK